MVHGNEAWAWSRKLCGNSLSLLIARRRFIDRLLADGFASIDDVASLIEVPHDCDARFLGAVATPFVRKKIIVEDYMVRSTRPKIHARRIVCWRLIDAAAARAWLDTNPESPVPEKQRSFLDESERK